MTRLWVIVSVFVLLCSWVIASMYPVGMFDEPRLGTYRSDEMVFLKTYYLVEKEWNYYSAFAWAIKGDVRRITLTSDVFQWRLPTVFYVWKMLANNGWQILFLFWVLALGCLLGIYLLVKKFVGGRGGMIAIVLLLPYFADAFQYQSSFLFTEWWGWFWFIFGVTAFVYDRKLVAGSLLLAAAVTRELLIVPIIVFFGISLMQKKHRGLFLIVMGFFAVFMWLHWNAVTNYMQGVYISTFNPIKRLHGFDKNSLMPMVAFMMRRYPLIQYKSNWLLVGLAGLSLGKFLWQRKFNTKLIYLYASGWSLLLVLPFISTSVYNDYWGILFMPTLLVSVPFLWLRSSPK